MRFSPPFSKRLALLARAALISLVMLGIPGWTLPAAAQEVPLEEVPLEEVPPLVEPPAEPLEEIPPLVVPPLELPPPPVINPRYGVVYTRTLPPDQIARFQGEFGAAAWLDMNAAPSPVAGKVPLLPLDPAHRLSGEKLAALVLQHSPGTVWYVGGEANVPTQGNITGAAYAAYFREAAATIRAVDPTARVMAASVLNFVDTCGGCAGYTPGKDWIEEFRATHWALFGEEPAVDIWALDSYLLDWNNLPMIDPAFLPRQVTALREYLDAIPGQAGKPIWVTEFGVVWAYEALRWVELEGVVNIVPARAFRQDLLHHWLQETVTWLETTGVSLGVERWFLFGTHKPPGEPWYTGIELLEPVDPLVDPLANGYRLNPIGAQYAAAARATAPVPLDLAPVASPESPQAPALSAETVGE